MYDETRKATLTTTATIDELQLILDEVEIIAQCNTIAKNSNNLWFKSVKIQVNDSNKYELKTGYPAKEKRTVKYFFLILH